MGKVTLRRVDLSKGYKHNHPDIRTDNTSYLIKHDGSRFAGKFNKAWFGLSFSDWHGGPLQFDVPGYNGSAWEAVLEIVEWPEKET